MKNSKIHTLLAGLNKRLNNKVYVPKFMIGDLIINKFTKYGQTMELICHVNGINRDENDLACKSATYNLETLFNSGVKKNTYTRQVFVRSIDVYYNIIKPEVAQVLYGIDISKRIDIKKPLVKGE